MTPEQRAREAMDAWRARSDLSLIDAVAAAIREENEACAAVAQERARICADAVAKIEAGELYRDAPGALDTETCAKLEAQHIAELIEARLKESENAG